MDIISNKKLVEIMKQIWSEKLPVVQFRVARPTDKLQEVVKFYHDGIGLEVISSFKNHDGYDGVMLGLPDIHYHLEFTQHIKGSPCPAPSLDNLMVFYMPDKEKRDEIVNRLAAMGFHPVPAENPYWDKNGVTIEDPDGWRVVLMNTNGIG